MSESKLWNGTETRQDQLGISPPASLETLANIA